MANGLPFIKFFPSDWLSDEKLRLVSLPARGLWIDMLCLMAKAEHRGYLELSDGVPLPANNLARLVGVTVAQVDRLLLELETAGVFSRTGGVIYSRRLVRDTEFRRKCTEAGNLGGNPRLLPSKVQPLTQPLSQPLTLPLSDSPTQALSPQKPEAQRHIKQTSNPARPAKPARASDVLFEALAIAEGSNPKELTKDGGGRIGTALSQIKAACAAAGMDLTISEISKRARVYRSVMPAGSRLTAHALAVNWAKCGGGASPHAPVADGLPQPEGWREKLEAAHPGNLINADGRGWGDVPLEIKRQVFPELFPLDQSGRPSAA